LNSKSNPALISQPIEQESNAPQNSTMNLSIVGVARVLVQTGVINEKKALEIGEKATTENITFMEALSKDNKNTSKKAAYHLALVFDLPYIDLDSIDPEVFPPESMFDRKKIEDLRVIPLFIRGQKIYLATSDPTETGKHEYFSHKSSGKRNELIVVDESQIISFLSGSSSGINIDQDDVNLDLEDDSTSNSQGEDSVDDEREDSPVVKLVQGILLTAIKKGASDIHFEPYEKIYRIRFRIDGILQEVARPALSLARKIASRIKVISSLNIAEKRVPQDGKMRLKIGVGRSIDFRVSTLPVLGDNEKIVMRILDPSQSQMGIESLGYEPEQKAALLEAINRPEGLVLVTGPTGSGKTVSLYTCLNILNTPEVNIATAEDPAEIQLPGVNQVSVNPAQGLTFAAALKAFLRQDPDIIMVGEIRDEETAGISVKAATTGHLVLATLHTNSAPKTISRLVEIGVKPYEIAASVNLITAQRLLRRICQVCRKKYNISEEMLRSSGMSKENAMNVNKTWTAYEPNKDGCDQCNKGGYKRRVGIYEVMPISDEMREIITRNGNSIEISNQAQKEGINNLRQSGLMKFMQGLTSLDEVLGST
jgi:type IV pilus assembly protein PilB